MKKISILFIVLSSIVNLVFAQTNSTPFVSKRTGSIKMISRAEVSDGERANYWRNTKMAPDGYMLYESNEKYVNLIDGFSQMRIHKKVEGKNIPRIERFSLTGEIEEDINRHTYIYADNAGQRMMITIWKYKEAGATINVQDEFVNNVFKDMPAIISLATSPESDRGLWKAAVWNSDYYVEIYIEDILSRSAVPSRSFPAVQNLMRGVIKQYIG